MIIMLILCRFTHGKLQTSRKYDDTLNGNIFSVTIIMFCKLVCLAGYADLKIEQRLGVIRSIVGSDDGPLGNSLTTRNTIPNTAAGKDDEGLGRVSAA